MNTTKKKVKEEMRNKTKSDPKLQHLQAKLREAHPTEILQWGIEKFGAERIVLACSFGLEDVALVDMLTKINPNVDIFYIDTGLLFKETYETRYRLAKRYRKDFKRISGLTLAEQKEKWGSSLWKRDPNHCCQLRKVAPLKEALKHYDAWITGIRREQAPTRAQAEVIEQDHVFNLIKLNPLAFWKEHEVWDYVVKQNVPYNPLHDQNYPSIGCAPCTRPALPGKDPRSGRWAGLNKIECGLHSAEQP